jgi:hypothetical protein
MTENSSNSYTYYSFPPTPNRNSPRSIRSRSISSTASATSHRTLRTSKAPLELESNMPSPAAGKGETPRTPTKLGRKPQQSAPKLGKSSKSQGDSSAGLEVVGGNSRIVISARAGSNPLQVFPLISPHPGLMLMDFT